MTSDSIAQALSYLDLQPMRNIAACKFLRLYSTEQLVLHHNADGAIDGVLSVFPTAQFGYDAANYPQVRRMVLINHDSVSSGIALLEHMPKDNALVFKLLDERLLSALGHTYQLQRACSFESFTQGAKIENTQLATAVTIAHELSADCIPLYQANNYTIDELQHYFSHPQSVCYALRHHETREVLCAAISYANDQWLHEIAALYTPLEHRRKGYAQKVVLAAVQHISALGKQVRYQARDDNLASIRLAEAVGLVRFSSLTHYLASKMTS